MKQRFFIGLGILMVGLGTAGIFLPGLPTTPFLLLAAYLFSRSSRRWHDWLLHHKRLGPYIHAWRNKCGYTVGQKVRMGLLLSLMMGLSIYFAPIPAVKCLLGGIWAFWTVVLLRQKTLAEPAASPN